MPRFRSLPLVLLMVLLAACLPLPTAPEDVPPQVTPIVEFPTVPAPTATPRPALKPIFADDMLEARTTFLIIQTSMAAGDWSGIAARVLYPIDVLVEGSTMTIESPGEFEQYFGAIFTKSLQEAILAADEEDLIQMLDGIRAADGHLWLNQFCADAACSQGQFLITQINN